MNSFVNPGFISGSRFRGISEVSGGVIVRFAGSPGLTYSVQRASTLAGLWITIATVTVADDGVGTLLDPNPPPTEAFYRISFP